MKKDLFLITGASTGIGYALAKHFAEEGHTVLAGVRASKDFEAMKKIANVIPITLDVTKSADLDQVPAQLEKHLKDHNRLILINNAGVVVHGPWELISEADLRRQIETNVFGPIFLTQKCLPSLRKTKGHIFNISSVAGLFSSPFMGPYGVSKYAIESFSDSLRRELMNLGVNVTTINPGPINTPIWQKGLSDKNNQTFNDDPVYGKTLKRFEAAIKDSVKTALDVGFVTDAVDRAYHSTKPPTRTVVTTFTTKTVVGLSRVLPARLVDNILKRF